MPPSQSERQITLSFYDHHRQNYGHMPIRRENAIAEFMIGDYGQPGEDQGVDRGGEFTIYLYQLSGLARERSLSAQVCAFDDSTGSLTAFLASGAWDTICEADMRTRDDLTALLLGAGLYDRSNNPIGHKPVCHCCGRPTNVG